MKIFCISDSLGLPRIGVPYEVTWYYLVKKRYPVADFYPYFIRNLTSEALDGIYFNYISHYNPSCIIVQLGICDCSPRIVNTNKLFWKIYFKFFKLIDSLDLGWRIVKKFYKRNNPDRVYVPINRFKTNNELFLKRCINSNIKVLYVLIAKPASCLCDRSPAIFKNVEKYNVVLTELANAYPDSVSVINPLKDGATEDYTEDGYHTKKEGALKVFDKICEYLDKVIVSNTDRLEK